METNWIVLILILICAIALLIFLVIRNQKDKQDVIESLNAQDDIEHETEQDKNIE
jgi:preprotein translocase subunit YajC